MARKLLPRLLFLAALGGGLLLWAQQRRPRELAVRIDLSSAMPGEISGLDAVVRRGGHVLVRHDERYGAAGAPGLVELRVHAAPGEAEVETTLVYSGRPARRSVARVELSDEPARVRAQ